VGSTTPVANFLGGGSRRSYFVIALPIGVGAGLISALAFWIGYTRAYAEWDEDAPIDEHDLEATADDPVTATTEPGNSAGKLN
jgi:hypothetical protein